MKSILIIDDDEGLCNALSLCLTLNNYEVQTALTAKDGLNKLNSNKLDLLLLDLCLPDMDGKDLLRKIRNFDTNLRIIVITACTDEFEHINLLKLSADDYLIKPFTDDMLQAYIEKAFKHQRIDSSDKLFKTKDFILDFRNQDIHINNKILQLSKTEYKLLSFLIENKDLNLDNKYILQTIFYNNRSETTEIVRTYIKKLRNIIEPDPKNPKYIITIPAIGYRFQSSSTF